MKKKDWAIIAGAFVYSFLFYHQNAGLNFLLFSIVMIFLFVFLDPHVLKNKMWLLTVFLTLVSGTFVLMYGSSFSILANCVCLLLLPAVSFSGGSSVIMNLIFALYSLGGSIVFMIIVWVNAFAGTDTDKKPGILKLFTFLVPVILGLVFFFIYKNINPLFEKYTDVISAEWVLFLAGGFFMVYGLISHQRIKQMEDWESKKSSGVKANETFTEIWNEKTAFIILFVSLNIMMFFINALDINYLYLGAGMPVGLTHKEFVHNGVGMLIFSIALGIGVILYFFRGALNFYADNKIFKSLVYAWIFQNLMMVFATAIRNKMYIDDALLTYKRIGVYFWIFMAACGLLYTALKIWKTKSNWYIIRSNSFVAFLILVAGSGIDWDRYISDYNIRNSNNLASLDKRYLLSLSETNIKQLYDIKDLPGFNVDSIYHYRYYSRGELNSSVLDCKLYDYLKAAGNGDWRSYNIKRARVGKEIAELYKSKKINELDFSAGYIPTLMPVFEFSNIKSINLRSCDQQVFSEIHHFPLLEKISVTHLEDSSIKYLRKLKKLKTICVYFSKYSSSSANTLIAKLSNAMPDVEIVHVRTND